MDTGRLDHTSDLDTRFHYLDPKQKDQEKCFNLNLGYQFCPDLELFLLAVEVNLDDEVAVEELPRDVGAGPHLGAEVEDEAVGLAQ